MQRRSVSVCLLILACSSAAFAQPAIFPRGVVNAASYMPPGMPGGGIARGSVFTIFGQRLGPDTSPSLAFPLSTNLGGVTIRAFAPGGGPAVDAIPLFVSATQINAIMPSNAPLGMVSVQVKSQNGTTNPAPVRVVNSSFGIFTIAGGLGPGILQNFNSATDQPVNALNAAARPGQAITLWGTGLGPATFPDNVAPAPGSFATPTEVFVGGKSAPILYNGRSPCCSGVDQIVFTIPNDAPAGCWVPIQVRTEGKLVSNSVTMAIGADGSPCSDSFNPAGKIIANGGKLGAVVLRRTVFREDYAQSPTDVTADITVSDIQQEKGGPFAFSTTFSLPPPGSCTTYNVTGNIFGGTDKLPFAAPSGRYLDLGTTLAVSGSAGGRSAVLIPGNRYTWLGEAATGEVRLAPKSAPLLSAGTYSVAGRGGADVGAFQFSVTMPQAITWINEDLLKTIDRSQPLTINWSGAPAGTPVIIQGGNGDLATNSTAEFMCIAPGGASSFTVPTAILANIPATRTRARFSKGIVYVGLWPYANPATINATGLDLGIGGATYFAARQVKFQ